MKIAVELPEEFLALCKSDNVDPNTVLRGFIADVSGIINWGGKRQDGYSSNGSDEREMAYAYYKRVGYPYWPGGSMEIEPQESSERPWYCVCSESACCCGVYKDA